MAIADLNRDGKPDLAVAKDPGIVSVLPGHGDGSFEPGSDYETGSFPRHVEIGDLNNDGRLDLVTSNQNSSSVSVLLGNGDGTFGPEREYGAGIGCFSVAIGDLNGDRKPDLVVSNGLYTSISVLLGNGDGTFEPKTDYATGDVPSSVGIGDLNGDRKRDVALVNVLFGTVSVLLGNGDGTLAPRTDYETGENPFGVAIGDLNADGKPDLAVANLISGTVSVLLNIGPGCPSAPMSLDLAPNTLNLRSMGHWVTATLEPEPPASPADIDVASILMNRSVPVDASAPASIGDADGDGRPDLTVRFNRAAVELKVAEGEAVPVTVSGKIGSGCFETTDVIRVRRAHVPALGGGSAPEGGDTAGVPSLALELKSSSPRADLSVSFTSPVPSRRRWWPTM